MSRESLEAKAQRYLISGRLNVRLAGPQRVEAVCRGDSGHCYRLGHENDVWWCSCPARGRCCHMMALKRVVVRPGVEALR